MILDPVKQVINIKHHMTQGLILLMRKTEGCRRKWFGAMVSMRLARLEAWVLNSHGGTSSGPLGFSASSKQGVREGSL